MIVVTGATGQLGSRIVEKLLEKRIPTRWASVSAMSPQRGASRIGASASGPQTSRNSKPSLPQ